MTKEEIIERFKMEPHVEGGYFKEVVKSDIKYNEEQTLYSSILFLLGENDISHMHILKEDELWYYQGGDDCTIVDIDENYNVKFVHLGLKSKDSLPQYLVKKGHIFASKYEKKKYTLVGCMVSPSFSYDHFKLVKKEDIKGKIDNKIYQKIEDMFID